LTFIYLEMPKFNKTVDELENRFDKWMYVIRNLNRLDRIPEKLRGQIFEKVFEVAEIAKFSPEQIRAYEDSLKYYRDLKASLDTSYEEGMEKGVEKGKFERSIEIAKELLASGVDMDIIISATGLSRKQIERLK